jgi:hypothetical protein
MNSSDQPFRLQKRLNHPRSPALGISNKDLTNAMVFEIVTASTHTECNGLPNSNARNEVPKGNINRTRNATTYSYIHPASLIDRSLVVSPTSALNPPRYATQSDLELRREESDKS